MCTITTAGSFKFGKPQAPLCLESWPMSISFQNAPPLPLCIAVHLNLSLKFPRAAWNHLMKELSSLCSLLSHPNPSLVFLTVPWIARYFMGFLFLWLFFHCLSYPQLPKKPSASWDQGHSFADHSIPVHAGYGKHHLNGGEVVCILVCFLLLW